VSLGNRADVSPNDLLSYWEDDPASDVIVLYVESFGNPRRFGRLARRVSRTKPIIVVKAGRSSSGARAAASHTGSLASLDVAVDALFHQSGVIRTDTLHELFDVTALLANQPLPGGCRVAVLSNAGGPAILAADALEGLDLELPELSASLQSQLAEHLPPAATTANPVDMIASAGPDEFRSCLSVLLDSDEIDSVIVIFIPTAPEGTRNVVLAVRDAVLGVLMRSTEATDELSRSAAKVPVYPYPESAARALAKAVRYQEWCNKPEGEYVRYPDIDRSGAEGILRGAIAGRGPGGGWLDASEVDRLLALYGIPTARAVTIHSEDEAAEAAAAIGRPVAVKVVSPSVIHKSDVGGVVLDVSGNEEVRAAYRQVTSVAENADGAVIQEFLGHAHEVIVGMTEDPLFGPFIVFGLGGIFVELMRDVSFRINPLTDVDAREMLSEVRSAELLTGYRGEAGGDVGALEELVLRVSVLVENHPEVAEMDLNPVMVFPPGKGVVVVVDARIRTRPLPGVFLPSRKDIPGRML
jgi:acyl-CoA synthetase (NDP forming)